MANDNDRDDDDELSELEELGGFSALASTRKLQEQIRAATGALGLSSDVSAYAAQALGGIVGLSDVLRQPPMSVLDAVSPEIRRLLNSAEVGYASSSLDPIAHLLAPQRDISSLLPPTFAERVGGVENLPTPGLAGLASTNAYTSDLLERLGVDQSRSAASALGALSSYLPTFETGLTGLQNTFAANVAELASTSSLYPSIIESALQTTQNSFKANLDESFLGLAGGAVGASPLSFNGFSSSALGGLLDSVAASQFAAPSIADLFPTLGALLDLEVESLLSPDGRESTGEFDAETAVTAEHRTSANLASRGKKKKRRKLSPWQVFVLQTLLQTFLNIIGPDVYSAAKDAANPGGGAETKTQEAVSDLQKRDDNLARKLAEFEAFARPILLEVFVAQEYIVVRGAPLRVDADAKSAVEARVYPNTRVEMKEMRGGWVYVEYRDDLAGINRMGWIHRKHLKPMEE